MTIRAGRHPSLLLPLAGVVLLALAACATTPAGQKDLLGFLADGATKKEEVERKLGRPSRQFEDSRVLTYRIGEDKKGYFQDTETSTDWSTCRYSLVLVFDADNTLVRHSLVDVRPQ